MTLFRTSFLGFAATPLVLLSLQGAEPRRISYSTDVEPIFRTRCVSCHGVKSPAEGLDLSSLAGVRLGSAGGAVIVLGVPERSRLFTAVVPHSGRASMPPGRPLSPEQVDILREWIRQGASWTETPPVRPRVPQVARKEWVRNPIDAFVLHRLEREVLAPSPETDKSTLLRRLAFGLTGTPPTKQQVTRFTVDRRPDAYARWVDDLLAKRRLDPAALAQWSAAQSDPIQARIEVNRVWTRLFGRGLAEGFENVAPPSHPELLDWLTTEALRSGWNIEALHRLIVTSATYRQSSKAPKELLDRDPKNELLGRGPLPP